MIFLPSPTKLDYFDDKVRVLIDDLLGDSIGDSYSQEELAKIYTDGKERYDNQIPPGFKDRKEKEGKTFHYGGICYHEEFGDLVIWFQILDFIQVIRG